MKTSELRACDNCGGTIIPIFYHMEIKSRQYAIDMTAVNEVVGVAKQFGDNMLMGNVMSPNRDATVEMPGYKIDKDIFLCPKCATADTVIIRSVNLLVESEQQSDEVA